jgi:hypothetical protein
VLLAWLFLAARAGAEPVPESAEALFTRARSLMRAGDCTGALPLLEQSHAMEPTVGTRFNLAICEERLGKLTQAAAHLRSVVDASASDDDRRAHAERALRQLLPRIPQLVLELEAARQELELVRLDGEPLSALRPSEPFAINPGQHELEVILVGETPQVRRFRVAERQVYTWSLGGVGTESPVSSPLAQDQRAANGSDAPGAADAERSENIWTTQRTVAVVAAGTSVAAFGVATGFALGARSVYDTSAPNCPSDDICDSEGIEERTRARQYGNVATVALTVGVTSALAAGILWFTGAPRGASRPGPVQVGFHLRRGRTNHAGFVVEGWY